MLPMQKLTVRVRAVAAGLGQSEGEKKTKYVWITGSVEDDEFKGEQQTAFLYFTEKTTARSIESLMHFGFTSDDLSLLDGADANRCAELLPDVAVFVCEPEEYNGEWSLKVKWVNSASRGGGFAPKNKLEGADAKAFAAQMKGALRNARGAAAASNGQRQTPSAPVRQKDDDIPF